MRMSENRELFWKLLEPEYFRAMMFCRKLMGDREHGDDLFQDALMLALQRFESLREYSSFRPWLYRIMTNAFKSKVRRPWWKRVIPLTPEIETGLVDDDPSDNYGARRWMKRAFSVLSTDERALVTMHELEGWPAAELVGVFGHSEGAIRARLFRARKKMKKALTDPRTKDAMCEDDPCFVAKPNAD